MTRNFNFGRAKRVVIKIGTSVLTNDEGHFSLSALSRIGSQLEFTLKSKREVVIVSSGAIGCGMKVLGYKKRPNELPLLQACAAVGQGKLMKAYEDIFSSFGYHSAQVLLTRDGLQDRVRCLNIKNTLRTLLRTDAIPVVNENDTVSTEEIRFGDNDTLSVAVAEVIEADLLILLTDVDGIYQNGNAQSVVSEVASQQEVDALFQHVFSHQKKVVTMGGMRSKLEVAKRAMKNGIPTVIMNGKNPQGLMQLFQGENIGTLVTAGKVRQGFKKNWLVHLTEAHGNLTIDTGARKALVEGGKSLLPSGVIDVTGHFRAGDSVRISTAEGKVFARGIVNYSSDELQKIKGKKTKDIIAILGYAHQAEVIHRDNLVMTE